MWSSSQITAHLSNFKRPVLDRLRVLAGGLQKSRCLFCDGKASVQAICEGCRTDLPWLQDDRCLICAHPLPVSGICGRCIADIPHFDHVTTACSYAYPLDGLIQSCKYGGRLAAIRALAFLLPAALPRLPDVIVPMPLSPQRLRVRGFNQALELARHAANGIRAPIAADLCVKVRDTPSQTDLPWKERRKNVRGAFVVRERLDGLHIAVVDDVLTTGATLNEIARNLKKSGALTVSGWIVARTVAGGTWRR